MSRYPVVALALLLCSVGVAGAAIWNSAADFSANQGGDDWSYMYWDVADGSYHEMVYGIRDVAYRREYPLVPVWYADVGFDEHCSIYWDMMHPLAGSSANPGSRELWAARVWTAPRTATLDVAVSVVDEYQDISAPAADGIYASMQFNSATLWQQPIAYQTLVPAVASFSLSVAPGDRLYFQVAPGANDYYDHFTYHVEISEVPEPALGILLLLGVVPLGIIWRRRERGSASA